MKEGNDGFVRADQIDLKSLDEQLERHLNRVWTMESNIKKQDQLSSSFGAASATVTPTVIAATSAPPARQRQEWEIDPAKLIIKTVLARGTFGTVHRGVYDGLDVAGQFSTSILAIIIIQVFLIFIRITLSFYVSRLFILSILAEVKKYQKYCRI